MPYPTEYDSFTAIKVNGDSATETISLPASTAPFTVTSTYAIKSGLTVSGYTEVTTTPATGQFRVFYGSKTIEFGPTPTATSVTAAYTTRGTSLADIQWQAILDALNNIEEALGLSPNGSYSTVADRLSAVESAVMHSHHTEDLSASCDGSNVTFTLVLAPAIITSTVLVHNATQLTYGTDYTISGTTLTMTTAPDSGTKLIVHYIA